MLRGVKLFVLVVFLALGLSFIAPTVVMAWEFPIDDWLMLATFYSHLFIFFPTFGVVTLCAFYMPACVFTDMYWRYIRYGQVRFVIGTIVLVGLSAWIASWLSAGRERSIFEIAPATLAADTGAPANCGPGRIACERLAILPAAHNVRAVSQQRVGLTDLARSCRADPLVEAAPEAAQRKRFCFASTPFQTGAGLATDAQCCAAQRAFIEAVVEMHRSEVQRSLTGRVHHVVLAGKIFFMLVLLIISVLLAVWRRAMESHYERFLPGIERGVLIGAVGMVVYPIMSHAFLQSAALLYGDSAEAGYRAAAPYFTFIFGAWALLLVFFFYRRRDKDVEQIGRLGGVLAGAVAIFKYDLIIDVFVRVFGSGATPVTLAALLVVAVFAIVALFVQTAEELTARRAAQRGLRPPAGG
jgi:hypothetical protein